MTTLNDPSSPWHGAEIIHSYSDADALDDGVLVALPFGGLGARATAAVVADHAPKIGGVLQDFTKIRALWDQLKAVAPDDGWHVAVIEGQTFWLIPNEVGGLTLMYPEDY
jgi:hypothetical protein